MVRKSKPNGVLHGEEKIKLAAQIINKLWGIRQRYLQPGSRSFLLNDDLQTVSDSVSIFLDRYDRAASRQDLTIVVLSWVQYSNSSG
ncbi:hypothetical protein [Dendronalium sp. ChiSLP03b]|uniref:hypothetical protein n=1 Tax=Dendronalium sp. ChiSLP03b TaxID=3075381 RepID=UPI002AD417E1|nr:hypothetical protein [Dendronalium sp. ChiSLP03b]MDZ8202779.1 hypothetical protein [Dendronalium sp. ChiSLP03b]